MNETKTTRRQPSEGVKFGSFKEKDIYLTLKDINVSEVLKKEVMKFGKSGHVIIPQRHLNKQVFIVVPE